MACSTNYFPPGQKKQDINSFAIKFSDLALFNTYAERVGGGAGAADPQNVKNLVAACLATNRMTFCKSNGTCTVVTKIDLGAKAQVLKFGGAATGTAAGLTGLLAAGSTASVALGAATLGIGLIALPLLTIWAHHAQAKATEQATLCNVSGTWNAFAEAVERALAAGAINLQDANAQLSVVYQQLCGALVSITKGMNAGGYFQRALDALQIWNKEVVFPASVPQPPAALSSVGGPVNASSGSTGLLLTTGAGLAAHALGVF